MKRKIIAIYASIARRCQRTPTKTLRSEIDLHLRYNLIRFLRSLKTFLRVRTREKHCGCAQPEVKMDGPINIINISRVKLARRNDAGGRGAHPSRLGVKTNL